MQSAITERIYINGRKIANTSISLAKIIGLAVIMLSKNIKLALLGFALLPLIVLLTMLFKDNCLPGQLQNPCMQKIKSEDKNQNYGIPYADVTNL